MAPTNLEKAITERDVLKVELKIFEEDLARHAQTPLTAFDISHSFTQCTALKSDLREIHRRIVTCNPTDAAQHEQEFVALNRRIQATLRGFDNLKVTPIPSSQSSNSGSNTSDVRLPRLELPSFSGNPTDWISFKDQFVAAVHNNAKLASVQKLTYLKSALTGDAAKIVKSITITDANYDIAWQNLHDRFHNERELVFATLAKFLGQPVMSGESATGMRQLIDTSNECVRSLSELKVPVEHWDIIIVFVMLQRLDSETKKTWEMTLKDKTLPTFKSFLEFMEQRARALAAGGLLKCTSQSKPSQDAASRHSNHSKRNLVHHTDYSSSTCKICSAGSHPFFRCNSFTAMSVEDRNKAIGRLNLCYNCFGDHRIASCTSRSSCKTCHKRHNTLLHPSSSGTQQSNESNAPALTHHSNHDSTDERGMLATAVLKILDRYGNFQLCRVLLDGGSTTSLVTESCANRLGLARGRSCGDVKGLASANVGRIKGSLFVNIHPYFHTSEDEAIAVKMHILTEITTRLPTQKIDPKAFPDLDGLQLADPTFYKPGKIDVLLGSEVFWSLLMDGKKHGPTGTPIGIRSKLGWLVAGPQNLASSQILIHHADVDLDASLQRFWELESISSTPKLTKEEAECEEHFLATTARNENGRYVVSLPFKNSLQPDPISTLTSSSSKPNIGSSRETAIRRLKSLEKRIASQPLLQQQYSEFLDEYLSLGHMEEIKDANLTPPQESYYIPHHFVLKESSTTTKLRVVFDASCKSTSGFSLNQNLMVGPTVQDSLWNILMRFRLHPIAFTADIAKMYRQILVNQKDADFQRIVWRRSPSHPIQDFRLLTVTYGTASAPFHATRVLKQLSHDEHANFPLVQKIVEKSFYVDDVMSGAPTVDDALELQRQLRNLTTRGGFELRKWTSNHPSLLAALPLEHRETQLPISLDKDSLVKTLGLHWNAGTDTFTFKVQLPPFQPSGIISKRKLLSEMSMIFDPLGWLSPITIRTKLMFQQLWKLSCDWNHPLPDHIHDAWTIHRGNLHRIEEIQIPRLILPIPSHLSVKHALHCFSDASEQAYRAVCYLRSEMSDGTVTISLLTGKTRVAPSKQITLPRLELCGSLLLSNLAESIQEALSLNLDGIFAWTDSTIVLAWLKSHPSRWKTFVANRVAEIQGGIQMTWGHVAGVDNPADCASRGIDPSDLVKHPLWWNGPSWLRVGNSPFHDVIPAADHELVTTEERRVVVCVATELEPNIREVLHSHSSLTRLLRLTGWMLRFIRNCKSIPPKGSHAHLIPYSSSCILLPEELDRALTTWIKIAQEDNFKMEIDCLQQSRPISTKSKLISLKPFLDSLGVLRVGGRLKNAPIHADQKNPILLPRHHKLTELIIVHEHKRNLHGGAQLVLSLLQRRFWIISVRDAVRHQIRKCVVCARFRATTLQQIMGDLPSSRVTPTRPFLTTGVDYAGPFLVRAIPSRSKVTFKAYLALFICFSTHAIHLEVVSSLSTEAFLAALRRFTARRGRCRDMHSDCGTNFVGASRDLKEVLALLNSTGHNARVADHLSQEGIRWHFNPPGAPHFGGLWEAGVKSVKHHLHRVVGSTRMTFEELTTVTTQIEAALNSRPLTPCSTDPEDMTALTPGHFLIGEPLLAIPDIDLTMQRVNRLSRWQQVQQVTQHFWKRWSNEYLTRLQQRPKWLRHRKDLRVGDMVIVKEENLPPLKWKLGRVQFSHPGSDGITRVVTVKTAEGELKRPIVKLCLLPIDSNIEEPTINQIPCV